MLHKLNKIIITGCVAVVLIFVTLPLSAQESTDLPLDIPQITQCGDQNLPSYTALLTISDNYDVYIKLGKPDQIAPVTLSSQSFTDTACRTVGQTTANGKEWLKLGELGVSAEDLVTLILNTNAGEGLPSANRPALLLVSKANPACQPTTECFVEVSGKQAVLKGVSTLNNQDTLRVIRPSSITDDSITRVDYFVDGKAVYSTSSLEEFNMRYVGGGKHVLSTVITYESKQQAVIAETVEQSFAEELQHLLFMFWQQHKTMIWMMLGLLGVAALYSLFVSIARRIYKQRLWTKTHIVQTRKQALPDTMPVQALQQPQYYFQSEESEAWWIAKRGGGLMIYLTAIIVFLIILNSYFMQVFTTDGKSMEATLHSGDRMLINKLGKTFSLASNRAYIPRRGEVIVFQKRMHSDAFGLASGQAEKSYIVKRVFALPGERIVIDNGTVTIYNHDTEDGFNPEGNQPWAKYLQKYNLDNIDITLGTDELFVIGDNRPESVDSRANGPIKLEDIVGNAFVAVTPTLRKL